jgi:Flp pilus assembly protein TadD
VRAGLVRWSVIVGAVAWTAACGGARVRTATPPSGPTADVRSEITQAETAELARRHDVARAHYERAVASAHDPVSVFFARREYAETLITWGEDEAAVIQLERALDARPASPGSAAAWHDLGILRHHRGDVPGAITALTRARELAPRDVRPRVTLAAVRWRAGDRAGAEAEYRALLALDLPPRLRSKVQWALGELAKP